MLSLSLSLSLSERVQQQAADQRRGARSWRPLSDVDARRVRPLSLSLSLSLSRARACARPLPLSLPPSAAPSAEIERTTGTGGAVRDGN